LLERTPRGRKATRNTYEYMGLTPSPQFRQMSLLSADGE